MSETNDPHLRDDILAAYLDRALPAAERRVADDHLAECATCRDELVLMSKLVADGARVRRWPRLAASGAALAAAAVIAFAVVGPWRAVPGPNRPPGDLLRESTAVDGAVRRLVIVVTPAEGATVTPAGVRYVWHSVAPNASYRLTLTDEASSFRWTQDTPDTALALPDSVKLVPGRSYAWWVDALTADGRVASTGIRQFRTPK